MTSWWCGGFQQSKCKQLSINYVLPNNKVSIAVESREVLLDPSLFNNNNNNNNNNNDNNNNFNNNNNNRLRLVRVTPDRL